MADNNQGVPLTLQLKLKDCEQVINRKLKHFNFKIVKYELNPLENILGFFGEHMRVTILYNKDGKRKEAICFAKFFPRPHLQVDFELVSGAFKKEIFVYSFLFKKIQESGINMICDIVPECYFTEENSVLIFEELIIKGYKSLPRGEYLNFDHVVLIINTLAKLHASCLIYEIKSGTLETFFKNYEETFYSEKKNHKGRISFQASIKAIETEIEYFNLASNVMTTKEFKIIARHICYKMFDIVKPSKKYRNVLCHGDLWSTNYLIKYNNLKPIKAKLLDFQLARYCPPAHDIMGFLYITTSRQFRKQYMKQICDIYYNELSKNMFSFGYDLTSLIPRNEFDESCQEHKLFGAIQTATYYQMIQVDGNYMSEAIKDSKRWAHILYEDRSEVVLDNCKNDRSYEQKLKDTLENLKDICEAYVLNSK